MSTKRKTRKIEIFSAGCAVCKKTIELVNQLACPSCEVKVLSTRDPKVASRAKRLGIRSVPAVVIDGKLAECCSGRGPDKAALQAAGLGQAI
jgi:glutaredoxin